MKPPRGTFVAVKSPMAMKVSEMAKRTNPIAVIKYKGLLLTEGAVVPEQYMEMLHSDDNSVTKDAKDTDNKKDTDSKKDSNGKQKDK